MSHGSVEKRTDNRFPHVNATIPRDRLFKGAAGAKLREAIEDLYGAFAGCRLTQPLRYCSHCFTAEDAEYLTTTPLRNLTFCDISFILPKSTTTLGTDQDFNYFLPRVLEALAYEAHYMSYVLPDRFRRARISGWSGEQLAAVVQFITSFITAVNETAYNTTPVYEFNEILPELKSAIPELPSELAAKLNDPEAVD